MFEFDDFREIWSTIKQNKLRTFLTGFSVSWGIFMLIIMLAAGNGLRNGVMHNFRNMSMNKVQVWNGYTNKPWKGMQSGRVIHFYYRPTFGTTIHSMSIKNLSAEKCKASSPTMQRSIM